MVRLAEALLLTYGASVRGEEACAAVSAPSMVQMKSTRARNHIETAKAEPVVMYGSRRRDGSKIVCSSGYSPVLSERECRASMPLMQGGDPDHFLGAKDVPAQPGGCYWTPGSGDDYDYDDAGVWFNTGGSGSSPQQGAKIVCKKNFEVEVGKTLFVGDSDIDYWHTFAQAVPGAYNVGIGGDTCANKLVEIDKLLADFQPKAVVLCCGENDLTDTSVATTFSRWTQVVEKITASGARVIMMGTKPEPDSTNLLGKYRKYDAKVEQFAKSYSQASIAFIDVYNSFLAIGNKNKLYASDQLHMSSQGYKLWNTWTSQAFNDPSCVVWKSGACVWPEPPEVKYGTKGQTTCPEGFAPITSEAACRAAMPLIQGGDPDHFLGSEDDPAFPGGCYYCSGSADSCTTGVWLNTNAANVAVAGAQLVCQKNFQVEPGRTLFVGDSDIDYWHAFATAVPGSYNVGIGGDTCANKLTEIDKLLADFQPKAVVLCCGENDLNGADVATTYSRWTRVVEKITASGARVIMMGTKPEPDSKNIHAKYFGYDGDIRGYAMAHATATQSPVTFVDVSSSFQARGNPGNLYAADDLHLSSRGYKLWGQWVGIASRDTSGCTIWRGGECIWAKGQALVIAAPSTIGCPAQSHALITDAAACEAAAATRKIKTWQGTEDDNDWPRGCYHCGRGTKDCTHGTWFNEASAGTAKKGIDVLCKSSA